MIRFIPNTPVLPTWGQKLTTGQLSGLIYKTAAQEDKLSYNRQKIIEMTLFNITKDNMIVFMEI